MENWGYGSSSVACCVEGQDSMLAQESSGLVGPEPAGTRP